MARNFDNFPTYDPVLKKGTTDLSPIWADFLATFVETLSEYLTQNGVFVPKMTTTQRNALNDVQTGQMIYNTTTDKFQGFEGSPGAWVDFV